jgi:colanic acid biosynthesis glycosyl transferase WcaI
MPSAVVLYHYFYPDDVVSATHLTDLCVGLREKGWHVVALPCNRGCRDESKRYDLRTDWRGIEIRRVWRPRFRQSSGPGRIANLLWMLVAWSLAAFRYRPDVLVVGTDPILSVLVALPWKALRPDTKIVHWCFDLYPEAAIAGGVLRAESAVVRAIKRLLRAAYSRCDLLVDIGPCMRAKLSRYGPSMSHRTLTPWALAEPERPLPVNPGERTRLFGNARSGLLYSGNFGRAHSVCRVLSLARRVRGTGISFAFSVRGNGEVMLRSEIVPSDTNVVLCPFASQEQLEARLSAADILIVTLRDEWTGAVVPSKFFGALAAGRPVLFEGSEDCAIAQWIKAFGVGWVLTPASEEAVAEQIIKFCSNRAAISGMFSHCHRVYVENFSRNAVIGAWDTELQALCRPAFGGSSKNRTRGLSRLLRRLTDRVPLC